MKKVDVSLNLNCISNDGLFSVVQNHITKTSVDKDNKYVCIWFSNNEDPDLLIYAGEGEATNSLNDMFQCIRKASMKVV